jgi:hypothetical protein
LKSFDEKAKTAIINEIEEDFRIAYQGIVNYLEASLVFTLLCLLQKLLTKLKNTPYHEILLVLEFLIIQRPFSDRL